MIQHEHPSEKIHKWFPNAPNLDDGWTPIDFYSKVFGSAKSVESPAPRFARLLNFKRRHIKKHII